MNIETARELKALEIGYTSYNVMVGIYCRYSKYEELELHKKDAEKWVQGGKIPDDSMLKIEKHIKLFGENDAKGIKDRLEYSADISTSNPVLKDLISLVHTI